MQKKFLRTSAGLLALAFVSLLIVVGGSRLCRGGKHEDTFMSEMCSGTIPQRFRCRQHEEKKEVSWRDSIPVTRYLAVADPGGGHITSYQSTMPGELRTRLATMQWCELCHGGYEGTALAWDTFTPLWESARITEVGGVSTLTLHFRRRDPYHAPGPCRSWLERDQGDLYKAGYGNAWVPDEVQLNGNQGLRRLWAKAVWRAWKDAREQDAIEEAKQKAKQKRQKEYEYIRVELEKDPESRREYYCTLTMRRDRMREQDKEQDREAPKLPAPGPIKVVVLPRVWCEGSCCVVQ